MKLLMTMAMTLKILSMMMIVMSIIIVDGDDIYIMMQCLFVTFLFIPAPPPAQSCYVWIKPKVESRK